MDIAHRAISALRRIGIVVLIAITFLFGLTATVYLSLRSPEVKVPEVVGKDRFEAERILAKADLNFRVRATRASNQVNADTVLFQLPRAGEVVKAGQTVAMDISRSAKAGESSETAVPDDKANDKGSTEDKGVNRNTNASAVGKNDNENRPKKNKNTNKNANDNANANAGSRGANAHRTPANANVVNTRPREVGNNTNTNANAGPASQNENRRPPAPRPSPAAQNNNRPVP